MRSELSLKNWRRRSWIDRFLRDIEDMIREEFEAVREVVPFRREMRVAERGYREPFADVYETEDEVKVVAELPGVRKEDLDIRATENDVSTRPESWGKGRKSGQEGMSPSACSGDACQPQ